MCVCVCALINYIFIMQISAIAHFSSLRRCYLEFCILIFYLIYLYFCKFFLFSSVLCCFYVRLHNSTKPHWIEFRFFPFERSFINPRSYIRQFLIFLFHVVFTFDYAILLSHIGSKFRFFLFEWSVDPRSSVKLN